MRPYNILCTCKEVFVVLYKWQVASFYLIQLEASFLPHRLRFRVLRLSSFGLTLGHGQFPTGSLSIGSCTLTPQRVSKIATFGTRQNSPLGKISCRVEAGLQSTGTPDARLVPYRNSLLHAAGIVTLYLVPPTAPGLEGRRFISNT